MIEQIRDIGPETLARFDAIIDARAPSEFAEDHLPGAVNLPVLDDAERAEVGTLYKTRSRFEARRVGAAYVARNLARHLETALAGRENDFHPLLYCWRGGMRSNAMATVFSQVGWRCGLLEGGYKTWRRAVVAELRDNEAPLPIVLIDGQTGTAKSDILRAAAAKGVQVLDLEACASHRGSVFGGFADAPQPEQKHFETLLYDDVRRFDLSKPILVEAESNRIGRCEIPQRLWKAMLAAPRIVIEANPQIRAPYLLTAYGDIIGDGAAVKAAVERLKPFHPKDEIAEWRAMAETGQWRRLAEALMREHYDPAYERSRKRGRAGKPLARYRLDALDSATFERVAHDIASALDHRAISKDRPAI
ncbi:tRNA 2-selenouridine(34) synthase MnmH [Hyphococcus luteus]|uniref:tRNA 2-selenouridine(34) synthase MnmH n=1 Tax=Hyphococcus luteus TaxID=2058213 RepID=A0A2S7K4W3_9PROT|nr:tRNA 2-selenouridine(34) synthase MnmH [Marinicaulis flavus]PQA87478.1 tRNA 2-selenouridine(34) synthase MnmH [Marinicaulis flavus]